MKAYSRSLENHESRIEIVKELTPREEVPMLNTRELSDIFTEAEEAEQWRRLEKEIMAREIALSDPLFYLMIELGHASCDDFPNIYEYTRILQGRCN